MAFEAHPDGAAWDDAGEATTASLLAVFEYVCRHFQLRYCRIALFATGVGATAALVAVGRAPAMFEQRLKVICACDPALDRRLVEDGAAVTFEEKARRMMEFQTVEQLEAKLLTECVLPARVAVLLVSQQIRSRSLQLPKWQALHKLLLSNRLSCEVIAMEGTDDIQYFSEHPDELLDHLQTHLVGKGDQYEQIVLSSPRARLSPRNPLPNSPRSARLPPLSPRADSLPPVR